jgi:hypothetical protein
MMNYLTFSLLRQHASKQTQDLPFNLNLTSEQQQKRAQVPLPYEHTGGSHRAPIVRL